MIFPLCQPVQRICTLAFSGLLDTTAVQLVGRLLAKRMEGLQQGEVSCISWAINRQTVKKHPCEKSKLVDQQFLRGGVLNEISWFSPEEELVDFFDFLVPLETWDARLRGGLSFFFLDFPGSSDSLMDWKPLLSVLFCSCCRSNFASSLKTASFCFKFTSQDVNAASSPDLLWTSPEMDLFEWKGYRKKKEGRGCSKNTRSSGLQRLSASNNTEYFGANTPAARYECKNAASYVLTTRTITCKLHEM